jgi:tetratricopeptide (TPR) repeat protein
MWGNHSAMQPSLWKAGISLVIGLNFFSMQEIYAQDPLREGKIAFAKRNYSQAISLLQEAKKANPSSGEAYYYTGQVYERIGKKPEALKEYRRATELQLSPDLKEKAFWKLILHYRHVQDWDNLYTVSKRFLAFRPDPQVEKLRDQAEANLNPAKKRIQKLMDEGEAEEKRGRLAEAAAHYAEAARLDPDNIKTLWKAGDAYRRIDRFSEAIPYYKKAIAIDGGSWYSHFQAGVCYYGLKEFDEALESFRKAEKHNDRPDEKFIFYLNVGRGLAHLELEQIDEAERALNVIKKNRRLFEKSAPGSILAGMMILLRNDRSSIEPYLNRIASIEPDRLTLAVMRSIESINRGDYAEAERQMSPLETQKGIKRLHRYAAQAFILIAHYRYLNGQNEKALESLERLKLLGVEENRMQGALYRLAAANPVTPFREDNLSLVAKYAQGLQIFAAHPEQASAILAGRILFEQNDREKAWLFLNQAQADPLCRLYLAELQRERGEEDLARETLRSALSEDPNLKERLRDFVELADLLNAPKTQSEAKP